MSRERSEPPELFRQHSWIHPPRLVGFSRGVLSVTWFVSGGLLEAVAADLGDSSAVTAGASRGI